MLEWRPNANSIRGTAMVDAVSLAWTRFSRGLPAEITTIEQAIAAGVRSLEQWNTCMDTASNLVRRSDSHERSRNAGRKADSIPNRVHEVLELGDELTAEEISLALDRAQIDVVRRALKHHLEQGNINVVGTRGVNRSRVFAIAHKGCMRG